MWMIIIGSGVFILWRLERILKNPEVIIKGSLEEFLDEITKFVTHLYPTRRKRPRIVISYQKSKNAGEYNYHKNEITIYPRNNPTIKDIINTHIHEVIHHTTIISERRLQIYHDQTIEFGYYENPNEILCRCLSEELTERYLNSGLIKKWLWF